jgi:transcriptional regulator GlxA family with amidase domain
LITTSLHVIFVHMKQVSILVPNEAVMASIADPRYMFTAVNGFFAQMGKGPMFDVKLIGLSREVKLNDALFTIHTDALTDEVDATDLIIIPALSGDMTRAVEINKEFVPWINRQHEKGAEVASLCIGAFLLASTGLLKGKKCSTHWLYSNEFRAMFPDVGLVDDKVITEQNGLYSSGGAHSYWNLLLYLVEKHTNREIAILASKFFAIDIGRDSQSAFILFQGQKSHDDCEIRQAQEFIESNFRERLTVEQLSDRFGIGRRSFERRFKKATHNTVIEYIQRVKIEAAKKRFETTRLNINEVMYDVGYSDVKAFREVFRRITGVSPIEYRSKYCKSTH